MIHATPQAVVRARSTIARLRRPLVAMFAGGSVASFAAIHAVHLAAVAGGTAAVQFVCRIVN